MFKKVLLLILFIATTTIVNAQTYAGIEIGSKGIKMTIIEVSNVKKSIYEVKAFWTENIGIAKGIATTGKLNDEDINKAVEVVKNNYHKILNDYKVDNKNIYVVASSGVGMATNTDELIEKVKSVIPKNLDVMSTESESRFLLRGCIPSKLYSDGLVLDIGGGNTKGGYVEVGNNDKEIFYPLSINWGTITLTEKINNEKKPDKAGKMDNYIEQERSFRTRLRIEIKDLYKSKPLCQAKKNIYLSGGAVWAFYTLFYEGEATENYNEIKFDDMLYYNEILLFNFEKYENIAKTNSAVEKVLNTYSLKHLLSANNILIEMLENLEDIETKKLYFAKQGEIAWLISYIIESSSGSKTLN